MSINIWKRVLVSCVVGASLTGVAAAELRLAEVFGDHMVLQRNQRTNIWGFGTPGDLVMVTLADKIAIVGVGANGKFGARLDALPAGGPHVLTVQSATEVAVAMDVLMGDVWLAAGQSNMTWSVQNSSNGSSEVAAASYPEIRLFTVPQVESEVRQSDLPPSEWRVCTPGSAAEFSAVAYFFGRDLQATLDVPIGLITATWPGTPAEVWARRETIASTPGLESLITNMPPIDPSRPPMRSGVLYNGMIHPIQPFVMTGAIWYQGESNVQRAYQYRLLFPTLIQDLRDTWHLGSFPFYYVQIAPFQYEELFGVEAGAVAELREAQFRTIRIPNAGMVVTTDIGTPTNLHPPNKQEVGRRLSDWALADTYGLPRTTLGPVVGRVRFAGHRAVVYFANLGGGLATSDGAAPTDFQVAGEDRVFYPATAVIQGGRIRVISSSVSHPVAVRFAWDDDPQPNLFGGTGLPAVPFRSDQWPGVTSQNP